jgi:iron-sulfur cluster assembly protein
LPTINPNYNKKQILKKKMSDTNASSQTKKLPIINITDSALSKIKLLLEAKKEEVFAIRVSVRSGGCSGLSYVIEYASSFGIFDEKVVIDDITVLIDKKAVLYLLGSTMDYMEEQFKSGFVFLNPKERMKCGCGKSFNV